MFGKQLPYVMTDLDGTISNHDLSINPDTIKSIKKYQKASGYKLAFCTGRLDVCNLKIADDLNVQLPIISCNGTVITDLKTKEVLYADYLNYDKLLIILEKAVEIGLDILFYEPGRMGGNQDNPRVIMWIDFLKTIKKEKHKFEIITYKDSAELLKSYQRKEFSPVQIVFYFSEAKQHLISKLKELCDLYADDFVLAQSLTTMFNLTNKGANKLNGLKKWSEIVNTDYREVITFGDNGNDIQMIQGVNKGYAVGNAIDELKDVAYEVIEPIEANGVGKQLERILGK